MLAGACDLPEVAPGTVQPIHRGGATRYVDAPGRRSFCSDGNASFRGKVVAKQLEICFCEACRGLKCPFARSKFAPRKIICAPNTSRSAWGGHPAASRLPSFPRCPPAPRADTRPFSSPSRAPRPRACRLSSAGVYDFIVVAPTVHRSARSAERLRSAISAVRTRTTKTVRALSPRNGCSSTLRCPQ